MTTFPLSSGWKKLANVIHFFLTMRLNLAYPMLHVSAPSINSSTICLAPETNLGAGAGEKRNPLLVFIKINIDL